MDGKGPFGHVIPILRDDLLFPLEQSFDDFFNGFFGSSLDSAKSKSGYPKLEAGIEGDNWIVRVAVPGVTYESLNVEIEDKPQGDIHFPKGDIHFVQRTIAPLKMLKISGKMSEEYESPKDATMYRKELRKSSFTREITLPSEIEGEPDASLKDGILTLKWKLKSIEEPKKNTIKITVK
jgi:HSP20 family molecular chaperone IbpA